MVEIDFNGDNAKLIWPVRPRREEEAIGDVQDILASTDRCCRPRPRTSIAHGGVAPAGDVGGAPRDTVVAAVSAFNYVGDTHLVKPASQVG